MAKAGRATTKTKAGIEVNTPEPAATEDAGGKKAVTKITLIRTAHLKGINIVGGGSDGVNDVKGMIMHRFARKAWEELLLPSPKMNQAEKDENLKHDPIAEFRAALYTNRREPNAPTLFHMPNEMLHGALCAAAKDVPGAYMTEMERWTSIVSPTLYIYGIPKLLTKMVRNSDRNRTPDVRTRPIFPRWAVTNIHIKYKMQPLTDEGILNMLANGGIVCGAGDYRPQKGGAYGTFRLADADDPELLDIIKNEGRAAQEAAYMNPEYYDDDTADILEWFFAEVERREKELPSKIEGMIQ